MNNRGSAAGIIILVLFFVVGWMIADFVFEYQPFYIYSTSDLPSGKHFHPVDDKDFTGYAYFDDQENKIVFSVHNVGKKVWNFEDAKYFIHLKNDESYGLEFFEKINLAYNQSSFILNPNKTPDKDNHIMIWCSLPVFLEKSWDIDKVLGFTISVQKRKIRFGYQKYNIFGKLRTLIQEAL